MSVYAQKQTFNMFYVNVRFQYKQVIPCFMNALDFPGCTPNDSFEAIADIKFSYNERLLLVKYVCVLQS